MTNWNEQIKKMREQDFVGHSYNTVVTNNSMILEADTVSNISSEQNERLIKLEEENRKLKQSLSEASKKFSNKEAKEIIEKVLEEIKI